MCCYDEETFKIRTVQSFLRSIGTVHKPQKTLSVVCFILYPLVNVVKRYRTWFESYVLSCES